MRSWCRSTTAIHLFYPGRRTVPSPDRNAPRRGEPLGSMFRRRRSAYRLRLAARLLLAIGRDGL